METKLTAMFDYQRFDPSKRLAKLIRESAERAMRELSDDDLMQVSAAGESAMPAAGTLRRNTNDGGEDVQ